jgi:hypothetical protein
MRDISRLNDILNPEPETPSKGENLDGWENCHVPVVQIWEGEIAGLKLKPGEKVYHYGLKVEVVNLEATTDTVASDVTGIDGSCKDCIHHLVGIQDYPCNECTDNYPECSRWAPRDNVINDEPDDNDDTVASSTSANSVSEDFENISKLNSESLTSLKNPTLLKSIAHKLWKETSGLCAYNRLVDPGCKARPFKCVHPDNQNWACRFSRCPRIKW